jgi:hypothetical protein
VACEAHYRAGRATVTRWLTEAGKRKLLEQRKKFLKAQRSAEVEQRRKARAFNDGERLPPARTGTAPPADVDDEILHLAARWLQTRKAGGWVVYELPDRWWMVGTVRRSPAELLAKATEKGFDIERAKRQIEAFPDNLRREA